MSSAMTDPYASENNLTRANENSMPCQDPVSGGVVQPVNWSNSTMTISPGRWCKGWNMNNVQLNLEPGTYYVDQQLIASNSTITGTGVTIVLGTNFYNLILNQGTFHLIAPGKDATNALPGIVLTQLSDDTNEETYYFNNGDNVYFTGAIYFPTRDLYIQNNTTVSSIGGTEGCGQIITRSLTSVNNVQLGNKCDSSMGIQPFGTQSGWNSSSSSGSSGTSGAHPILVE